MKDKTMNTGGEILSGLNPEQQAAVTHAGGPLLIVAGAGTGKTHVITRRLAWLVIEQGIKPEEILALTFTNKAADEMIERVDKLLPYGYVDLWVSTFHTFCQRVLQQHALDIGLPADVELLDETGQWLLVRQHLDTFNLDYYRPGNNSTKFIHALLGHFSKLKDEEITPEAYLAYAEGLRLSQDDAEVSGGKHRHAELVSASVPTSKKQTLKQVQGDEISRDEARRIVEIANAYHTYQQLLLDNDRMDFGDLINYTLKLFRERPNVLATYQKQFKHILVDEFQDTNWAQYDLVKMLAAHHNNLVVVADDDQSIYRFRGASMSNVLQFSKDYGNAATVSLVRNYRSGQAILDAAYGFIQLNNPNRLEASVIAREGTPDRGNPNNAQGLVISNDGVQRDVRIAEPAPSEAWGSADTPPRNDKNASPFVINKKLVAETAELSHVEHVHCRSGTDEARIVVETILELKKQDTAATWNDFAILVRANSQADDFMSALERSGIPCRQSGSAGLYKERVVADMLAFFDVLCDYHEGRAVFRLLNVPFLDIAMADIIKLTHWADRRRVSLYSLLKEPQVAGVARSESLLAIKRLADWIEKFQALSKAKRATEILHAWLNEPGGYAEYIKILPEAEGLEQFRLVRAFWDHLLAIEKQVGDARLSDILDIIRAERQSGDHGELPMDMETGPELVRLLTVHAAKGLEFKYVFITNVVDRRFPTTERRDAIAIPDALVKEIIPEGDAHLEEERRLLYVGLTRAKRGLFLTSAENYGGSTKKKVSRFLVELAGAFPAFKLSTKPLAAPVNDFLSPRKAASPVTAALPVPKRFSFTQLRIYAGNPFEYKLQFIYKVPTLGKDVFSYGSTIHATLQRFFQLLAEKNRAQQSSLFGSVIAREGTPDRGNPNNAQGLVISNDGVQRDVRIAEPAPSEAWGSADTPPRNDIGVTLDELLAIYEECWIDDWYRTAEDKEKMRKQGKSRLQQFYEHLALGGVVPRIKALERPFNIKIGPYTIVGRIDRVDELPDGRVRIVDYKTGNMMNKINKKGELKEKEDKYQLLLYQIAAESVWQEKVAELVYHYIDAENIKSGENQIAFLGTDADKKEVSAWVLAQIRGIEAGEFPIRDASPFPSPEVEYVRDLGEAGII